MFKKDEYETPGTGKPHAILSKQVWRPKSYFLDILYILQGCIVLIIQH